MILRASKAKSKYKSENAWLDAVYRKNKKLIDFSFPETGDISSKARFKQKVREYKEVGYSTYKSTQLVTKTSAYVSKNGNELFKENIYKGIFSRTREREKFLKTAGLKAKEVDPSKFEYIGNGLYLYNNIIVETRYTGNLRIYKEDKNGKNER